MVSAQHLLWNIDCLQFTQKKEPNPDAPPIDADTAETTVISYASAYMRNGLLSGAMRSIMPRKT
jgi:hypothetical protein